LVDLYNGLKHIYITSLFLSNAIIIGFGRIDTIIAGYRYMLNLLD